MESWSDAELMLRLQSGEDEVFAEILDRHRDMMVNYLTRLTRSRERPKSWRRRRSCASTSRPIVIASRASCVRISFASRRICCARRRGAQNAGGRSPASWLPTASIPSLARRVECSATRRPSRSARRSRCCHYATGHLWSCVRSRAGRIARSPPAWAAGRAPSSRESAAAANSCGRCSNLIWNGESA